jgi:23S rRNA (uridine2552-2'-O)-methyltransferase
MREVQDHFFRLAKQQGYLSRAAYKLIDIDDRKHVLRRGDRVLDCGCAPGSWLQVASKRVGERGMVVGIDLQRIPRKIASNVRVIEGDFTAIAPEDLLRAAGLDPAAGQRFDVILSDMAPNTSGDPQGDHFRSARLCDDLLDRAGLLLRPGGNLVMKVFEGENYSDLVKRAERLFESARGFKPEASRKESREMFIVAHGWRGHDAAQSDTRPSDVNVLAPRRPDTPSPGWHGGRS